MTALVFALGFLGGACLVLTLWLAWFLIFVLPDFEL